MLRFSCHGTSPAWQGRLQAKRYLSFRAARVFRGGLLAFLVDMSRGVASAASLGPCSTHEKDLGLTLLEMKVAD
jgi:hypothetical protein